MKFYTNKIKATVAEDDCDHDEEEIIPGLISLSANGAWGPNSLAFYGKDSRSILIAGEVNEELANCVISQLLELADEPDPVTIYINTTGGAVTQAMAMFDMMRSVPYPIITIVTGNALSAGLLLSQAGDIKLATRHSRFFYHEPIGAYQVMSKDMANDVHDEYMWATTVYSETIRTRAGISKTKWKKFFEGRISKTFGVEEAKELKIIDDVIEYTKKKINKKAFFDGE